MCQQQRGLQPICSSKFIAQRVTCRVPVFDQALCLQRPRCPHTACEALCVCVCAYV